MLDIISVLRLEKHANQNDMEAINIVELVV